MAEFQPRPSNRGRNEISLIRDSVGCVTSIVRDLSICSAEYRLLWARHDVCASVSGSKAFRIPEVGDIVLEGDASPLPTCSA